MSYNKKQFALQMVKEIKEMQKKGFVYQSVNSIASLNNFVRLNFNIQLFNNEAVNKMLAAYHLHYAPVGIAWLDEDKKMHLKIKNKKVCICPHSLIALAEKKINPIRVKKDKTYLLTRK